MARLPSEFWKQNMLTSCSHLPAPDPIAVVANSTEQLRANHPWCNKLAGLLYLVVQESYAAPSLRRSTQVKSAEAKQEREWRNEMVRSRWIEMPVPVVVQNTKH
jgi:hypothetical protein